MSRPPDPPAPPDPIVTQTVATEHTALGWAALGSILAIIWLVRPVGIGILLGTCLAFMAQPLFMRLRARLGVSGAGALTVAVAMVAVIGVVGGILALFVTGGRELAAQLAASSGTGGVTHAALADIAKITDRFGLTQDDLVTHARSLATEAANRAGDLAAATMSTVGGTLLGLLFVLLSMHYILCNWEHVARRAQESLPLRPQYTAALFEEFRSVGRSTLLGAAGTSLAQGVVSTLGYMLAGVPQPLFFGAATAVASFVPAVGVLLLLVPIGVGFFLVGEPGHGVFVLAWGLVFVVGVCDYVIRPRLVSGERKVPSLVTFAAMFGGVEVLGLEGLIVGPVVMTLALSVLRLYAEEARKVRRDEGLALSPAPD